ncbi:MAG: DNA translocase FtsK 4TM domain-containing protein, partial [Rhodobacteraceae bacterium]|nr:DNA translocase FtsK 4TM domain-containing protein [Paracoccaceae bacterium]
MAYHPMRQRDPLFERGVQQALERRGRELLGLAVVGLGVAIAAMLGSYTPEDPSWMSATDAPARNHLGRGGAAVAAGLVVTIGLAAWGLAALAFGWGLRF